MDLVIPRTAIVGLVVALLVTSCSSDDPDYGAAVTSLSETIADDAPFSTQSARCIAGLLIEETGPGGLEAWEEWWSESASSPIITTQSSADAFADSMEMCLGFENLMVLAMSEFVETAVAECMAGYLPDDLVRAWLITTVLDPSVEGFTNELDEAVTIGVEACT